MPPSANPPGGRAAGGHSCFWGLGYERLAICISTFEALLCTLASLLFYYPYWGVAPATVSGVLGIVASISILLPTCVSALYRLYIVYIVYIVLRAFPELFLALPLVLTTKLELQLASSASSSMGVVTTAGELATTVRDQYTLYGVIVSLYTLRLVGFSFAMLRAYQAGKARKEEEYS